MLILVSWKVDFFGLGKEAKKYELWNGGWEGKVFVLKTDGLRKEGI
ncbi:hypothetical protein C943_03010 [Mariniradius saccharolyticus AK6]|uniref:Uncharacterized protein n=1 Tax=Mariniradius saccharolyticus AK6 TaxID=1239962 RepID=M7Y2Y1_9BACT|nr:hypothetical protein C943_03010 [Mariniradius saccharolyticus AK6]